MSQRTGHQRVTPELRRWAAQQLAQGSTPDALHKAMLASGWAPPVAAAALAEALAEQTAEALAAAPAKAATAARLPQPLATPGTRLLHTPDRAVEVLMDLRKPSLVLFGGLLSNDECDELVALAAARLTRSETVELDTGDSQVNDARTSEGMFFERAEHPLCARIEARIASLLDWPADHGEGLQVLRYRPGAEYKPHFDYFDPAQPGTPSILRRGGQRVATLIMYLNTPAAGGATVFPDAGLDVSAIKGNAVFFSYDRADPATLSLHGGAPVLGGEKWVATKWLREGVFI